jgi:hypothetical protein
MTHDELLKPRYVVIAYYPHCPYEIWDFVQEYSNGAWKLTETYHEGDLLNPQINTWPTEYLDNCSHLFRRMGWWEDRKEEDLPIYLKWDDKDTRPAPYIHKVKSHFNKSDSNWRNHSVKHFLSENGNTYTYSPFIPATEEEYLNQ